VSGRRLQLECGVAEPRELQSLQVHARSSNQRFYAVGAGL
jgi:hypothetical protein